MGISRDKSTRKMINIDSLRPYPGFDLLNLDEIKRNGMDNYKVTKLPKTMRSIINGHARQIKAYEEHELPHNWQRFKFMDEPHEHIIGEYEKVIELPELPMEESDDSDDSDDSDESDKPKKKKQKENVPEERGQEPDEPHPPRTKTVRFQKEMTDIFIDQVLLSSSARKGQVCGKSYVRRLVQNKGHFRVATAGRMGVPLVEPLQRLMQYSYKAEDAIKYIPVEQIHIEKQTKETCCFSSLCAAYKLLGDKEAYKVIHANIDESLTKDPFNFAMYLLRNSRLNICVEKFGWMQHDILEDKSRWPTMCQLLADDGTVNHCITTMGDFMFESNSDHPKEISKEFLDWCVSTDEEKCRYMGVVRAMRFWHQKPRSEWKLHVPVEIMDL